MDVAPPQAPPALTQSAQQASIDAVGRLVAARDWLQEQQSSMPTSDAIASQQAFAAHVQAIDNYWLDLVTYEGKALTRKEALARLMAGVAGDLASLMAQDGSLDEAAATTIRTMIASSASGMSQGIHAFELAVRDKPLASSLVLLPANNPGQVLVFTSEDGWRAVSDLPKLYRDMEQRARHRLTHRMDLPGLSRDDAHAALNAFTFGVKRLPADPWPALADRIVALQKEKLTQAWVDYLLLQNDPSRATYLADRMRDAVRLDDTIDIDSMLAMRDKRLHLVAQSDRLAGVPVAMRHDWFAAAAGYLSAHRAASGILADRGLQAPLDTEAFARQDTLVPARAERYDVYLDDLASGPDGALRKDLAIGLHHALMRLRAEDARLGYVLPGEATSFRDDHAQRGYRWVKAILDAPKPEDRAKVEGHDIVASQVMMGGHPVEGILAIGTRQPRSVPTVLLYTPDAPDGQHFREYDTWTDAIARFFHEPTFHDYLAERRPGLTEDVASSTPTRQDITTHLFGAIYDTAIDTARRSASFGGSMPAILTAAFRESTPPWRDVEEATTRSRSKRDLLTWVFRTFRKRPRGPLGEFAGWPLGVAQLTRLRTSAGQAQIFETDFLARNARKRGEPDARGLYRIEGQSYVAQGETLYGARYDSQIGTIRLQRPGSSPTSYGPAIRRVDGDRWSYDRIGLLGGGDEPARRPLSDVLLGGNGVQVRAAQRYQQFMRELEDAIPNPADRRATLDDFHRRLTVPNFVSTVPAEHQLRLEFAMRRSVNAYTPRPPSVPAPAPPGYVALADDEVPVLVYTPWRDEGHMVHIRTYGGHLSSYLRMESEALSATSQGIAVRMTNEAATMQTPMYSLRINLRDAYNTPIQPGQARFDVYRSQTDVNDLIIRPRGDLPLVLNNAEYNVALNPMPDLPSIDQLLRE